MKPEKILAIILGATMLGTTITTPATAEVTIPYGFPPKDFFYNPDGTPATKIVVGSQAAAADVRSAANLAAQIGNLAHVQVELEATIGDVEGARARIGYSLAARDSFLVYYHETGEYFQTLETPPTTLTLDTAYNISDPDYWPNAWIGPDEAEFMLGYTAKNRNTVYVPEDYGGQLKGDPYAPPYLPTYWNRRADLAWYGTGWDLPLMAWSYPPVEYLWIRGQVDFEDGPGDPEDWELDIPRGSYTSPYPEDDYFVSNELDYIDPREVDGIVYAIDFTDENDDIYGIDEGEEANILGGTYIIVEIDRDDDEVWIAQTSTGYRWVKTGETLEIGGYAIKLVDVNLFEAKAVVQLYKNGVLVAEDVVGYNVDPDEPYENVILNYNDGELIVKFGAAIVGAEGIVEAKMLVGYDAFKLRDNKRLPIDPDWDVDIVWRIDPEDDDDLVGWLIFTNNESFDDTTEVEGPADAWILEYIYDEFEQEYSDIEVGKIQISFERHNEIELEAGEEVTLPLEGNPLVDIGVIDLVLGALTLTIGEETYAIQPGEPAKIPFYTAAKVPYDLVLLDIEVTNDDKAGYNLIAVGGPVFNKLVKELKDLGKSVIAYKDLGPGNGAIEWIQDAFVEGKDVLIIAGSDRDGTTAATNKAMEELSKLV
ncbi:MAG: hypothetical protein DRO11_07220 [Methanobacteriota archaeon]|nr:MAG: hypothetical protein DRO11_07220 [Euryarchaeota archaeon]